MVLLLVPHRISIILFLIHMMIHADAGLQLLVRYSTIINIPTEAGIGITSMHQQEQQTREI